jgi:polyisoprenoid-binding protein YceI
VNTTAWPIALGIAGILGAVSAEADLLTLDPKNSTATFRVAVAGMAEVDGKVSQIGGDFELTASERITGLHITLPMTDITTESVLIDPMLRGEDLLDIRQYPEARFNGEEVSLKEPGVRAIDGILTLKGRGVPTHWILENFTCGPRETPGLRCEGLATTTLSRDAFGLTSYWGLIDQAIHVTVKVTASLTDTGRPLP